MPAIFGVFLVLMVAFQLFFRYESWPSKNSEGDIYERDRLTGETHKLSPGDKVGVIARLTGDFSHSQHASENEKQGNENQENTKQLVWQNDADQPNRLLVMSASQTDNEPMAVDSSNINNAALKRKLDYSRYRQPVTSGAATSAQNNTQPVYQMSMIETRPKAQEEIPRQSPAKSEATKKTPAPQQKEPAPEPVATNVKTEPAFRAVPLVSHPPTPPAVAEAGTKESASRTDTTYVPQTRSQPFDLNRDGVMEQVIQSRKSDGTMAISVVWQGREVFFVQGQQLQILPSSNAGWSDLAIVSNMGSQKWFYRFDPRQELYVKTQILPLRPSLAADDTHFRTRY